MSPLKTDISQSIDLVANGLSLGYGDKIIIDNLEAHFPPQKVTAIIGPNGCGKSTLLAGVCRVLKTFSGRVTINCQCIYSFSTRTVAQLFALLTHVSLLSPGLTDEEMMRHFH